MISVLLELITFALVFDIWRRVYRARHTFSCTQGYSAAICFVTSLLVLRVIGLGHVFYEERTGDALPALGQLAHSASQLLTIGFLYAWLLVALPGTTSTVMHALSAYKSRQSVRPSAPSSHAQGDLHNPQHRSNA